MVFLSLGNKRREREREKERVVRERGKQTQAKTDSLVSEFK
jgi:hypothetical protein